MWVAWGADWGWRRGDTGPGVVVFTEFELLGVKAVRGEVMSRSATEIGPEIAYICPKIAAVAFDPWAFVGSGAATGLVGIGLAGRRAGLVPGRNRIGIEFVGLIVATADWVLIPLALFG